MSIDEVLLSKKIEEQINIAKEKPTTIELKCILGSYGDTLDDEEILDLLKDYNTGRPIMQHIIAKVGDTPAIRRSRMEIIK